MSQAHPMLASAPSKRFQQIVTIVAVLSGLIVALKIISILQDGALSPQTDLASYFDGSLRLRQGLPIYRPDIDLVRSPLQFVYPPLLAFLLLPFATYSAAWWGWGLGSLICWSLSIALIVYTLREPLAQRIPARCARQRSVCAASYDRKY